MHDRYVGKRYRTVTFIQKNTATAPDGQARHSTWREYAALPGRLRIEFEPVDSGGGVLFVRDSQFAFSGGRPTSAKAFVHPLMVLGFDVYFDPSEATAVKLERLGYGLWMVHEGRVHGRPVLVGGA